MIHELREYRIRQAHWPEYQRLFVAVAVRIRGNDFGRLLGAWQIKDATLDQEGVVGFAHLWAYDSLDDRASRRARLGEIAAWSKEFLAPAKALIESQTLTVLNPQLDQRDASCGGGLHLYRYRCAVGEAIGVLARLKQASLRCWTTEFADPNEVACITSPVNAAALEAEAAALPQIRSARIARLRPIELAAAR